MGSEYDFDGCRNEAFARYLRRERITAWLARLLWVAGVVWFICWMQAGAAEDDAVIEACKGNQTIECMAKAKAEYRKHH
ncbi:MAG: hypothetical protein Q4D91_01030 [Lautropia sp.]|nr:hypothetical protein [Lautropia sp.]